MMDTIPQLTYDSFTPKDVAYNVKIECNFPGCRCEAINSHVVQKSRFVKSIAENGRVLQITDRHLQLLIDGDENGNFFKLHEPKDAMSLPLYCNEKSHDMKLFRRVEIKPMELDSDDTFLRLSYRAYCAARAQVQRRSIFYDINPTINPFCQGELFDYQKQYSRYIVDAMEDGITQCYKCMNKKQYEGYKFHHYTIDKRIPLCMSDCVFVEDELVSSRENKTPLSPLFVHVLPYDDKTEILIGYEVEHKTVFIQKVIDDWKDKEKYESAILNLLVYANIWCVSPSYFGDTTEKRNAVCEYILGKKIDFQMQGIY